MIESDAALSQGDVMRELADLKRAVRELQAGRRLEAATIGRGGITILDGVVRVVEAPDTERLVMGKLSDGDYGVEAVDETGVRVKLASLSSRTESRTINTQETRALNAFGDLTTPGPSVTVDIGPSGRALMMLSAKGGWSLVGADVYQGAFMSAEVSGASVLAASLLWGAWIETQHGSTNFSTVAGTISANYTFEALNPGSTTFTAKYMSGVNGLSADFARRTITVIAL